MHNYTAKLSIIQCMHLLGIYMLFAIIAHIIPLHWHGKCYNDILNHTGISSLKERRDHLCRKYFNDMKVNSHKLNC